VLPLSSPIFFKLLPQLLAPVDLAKMKSALRQRHHAVPLNSLIDPAQFVTIRLAGAHRHIATQGGNDEALVVARD
jgi:hypothetical protein